MLFRKIIVEAYLLDAPVNVLLDVLFDLLLTLVLITISFERVVQVDNPFGDDIGVLRAGTAMLGSGVDEFAVGANVAGCRQILLYMLGNLAKEDDDIEAFLELELLDTDASQPIEADLIVVRWGGAFTLIGCSETGLVGRPVEAPGRRSGRNKEARKTARLV